jgi:DNA-binding MarR family transcriptional regulator
VVVVRARPERVPEITPKQRRKLLAAIDRLALPEPQRLVLVAFAFYADGGGWMSPSVEQVCADTGLDTFTVTLAIRDLVRAGLIEEPES